MKINLSVYARALPSLERIPADVRSRALYVSAKCMATQVESKRMRPTVKCGSSACRKRLLKFLAQQFRLFRRFRQKLRRNARSFAVPAERNVVLEKLKAKLAAGRCTRSRFRDLFCSVHFHAYEEKWIDAEKLSGVKTQRSLTWKSRIIVPRIIRLLVDLKNHQHQTPRETADVKFRNKIKFKISDKQGARLEISSETILDNVSLPILNYHFNGSRATRSRPNDKIPPNFTLKMPHVCRNKKSRREETP